MSIGELTISKVQREYNLGFSYAKNIVDMLVEIGYIKPKNEYVYLLIATQEQIDSYIKEHMAELRPPEYNDFELKDNGEHTTKRKIADTFDNIINTAPIFLGRLIFSIPSLVVLIFLTIALSFATTEDAGRHLYVWEILLIDLVGYSIYIFPANIIFRIIYAKHLKMKFTDYMCLPKNWYFKRMHDANSIQKILHPEKKIILFSDYNSTLKELYPLLDQKIQLAKHYATIINTSYNETEFYIAINSLTDTLQWMLQFEEYGAFKSESKPSEDLYKLQTNMPGYEESLRKRISDMNHLQAALSQLSLIDEMDGHTFEYYCAELLEKNGFLNVEVTKGSGDHGIDLTAVKDEISYAIQCKCYSSNIGNSAVQQAHTGKSLYHKDIAVVLTNQYFTTQAKEEAAALGVKLWDRDTLTNMISNANIN